jgi:hypothetical protein
MGKEIEKKYAKDKKPITIALRIKILLCQNIGLLFGISIMFVLAKYGTNLESLVNL